MVTCWEKPWCFQDEKSKSLFQSEAWLSSIKVSIGLNAVHHTVDRFFCLPGCKRPGNSKPTRRSQSSPPTPRHCCMSPFQSRWLMWTNWTKGCHQWNTNWKLSGNLSTKTFWKWHRRCLSSIYLSNPQLDFPFFYSRYRMWVLSVLSVSLTVNYSYIILYNYIVLSVFSFIFILQGLVHNKMSQIGSNWIGLWCLLMNPPTRSQQLGCRVLKKKHETLKDFIAWNNFSFSWTSSRGLCSFWGSQELGME